MISAVNPKNQKQPPKIKRLVKEFLNSQDKSLKIYYERKHWKQILLYGDWSFVKELWVVQCQIKEGELLTISQLLWPNLQKLRLPTNLIKNSTIKQLQTNQFPKLNTLTLSHNLLSDEGIETLLSWQEQKQEKKTTNYKIATLKILYIGSICFIADHNNITIKGVSQFLKYTFKQMKELALSGNNIGNGGIKILVKADIPHLKNIWINQCSIQAEGVKHLCKSEWPRLQHLSLEKNYRQSDSTLFLANNTHWPMFRIINIQKLEPLLFMNMIPNNWKQQLMDDLVKNLCPLRRRINYSIINMYESQNNW